MIVETQVGYRVELGYGSEEQLKTVLSLTPDCNVEFLFVDGFAGEKFLIEIEATAMA